MAVRSLVPIKVKLFRKTDGSGIDWPSFNVISEEIRKGMVWSRYIDVMGIRWHYNKVANLGTRAPFGEACTCVPQDFADAAVVAFPDKVSILTEAEWVEFYDTKAHAHEPDEDINVELVKGIKLKQEMGLELTPGQADAINPNTDTRGIRKNKRKKWADFKQTLPDVTIVTVVSE